jgi:hypothetical protein
VDTLLFDSPLMVGWLISDMADMVRVARGDEYERRVECRQDAREVKKEGIRDLSKRRASILKKGRKTK